MRASPPASRPSPRVGPRADPKKRAPRTPKKRCVVPAAAWRNRKKRCVTSRFSYRIFLMPVLKTVARRCRVRVCTLQRIRRAAATGKRKT